MDNKDLENIQIPVGLEERLSGKIDEWERLEKKEQQMRRYKYLTVATIAACLVIAFGIGGHMLESKSMSDDNVKTCKGETDTYSDPDRAYAEAEKALELLSYNINKGMNMMNGE